MSAVAQALSGKGDNEGNEGRDPHEDVVPYEQGLPSPISPGVLQSHEVVDPMQLDRGRLNFRHHQ